MNNHHYAMDLLSLSENNYDIDAVSLNLTDDILNQFNNNILHYPTNGSPYSNSSIYDTSIAPNILEAPISTSSVSELNGKPLFLCKRLVQQVHYLLYILLSGTHLVPQLTQIL
jgi:hypothetical protein